MTFYVWRENDGGLDHFLARMYREQLMRPVTPEDITDEMALAVVHSYSDRLYDFDAATAMREAICEAFGVGREEPS